MIEALWMSVGAAIVVSAVMIVGGLYASDRSAARIDRLKAQAAERREANAVADKAH